MSISRKQAIIAMLFSAIPRLWAQEDTATGGGGGGNQNIASGILRKESSMAHANAKDIQELAYDGTGLGDDQGIYNIVEPGVDFSKLPVYSVDQRDLRPDQIMLEVRADGRVARFTAKEVMDALGGWFEPEGK